MASQRAAPDEIDQKWDDFMSREFTEEELDELIRTHRYKDRWDEAKWQEQMSAHPLFMRQEDLLKQSGELPPLIEAMQQLKYDPEMNSGRELANSYREDGNQNFKLKKYKWATDSYTEGLKALRADSDEEGIKLRSTLFGNRAAAQFHLRNYRSSLSDSLKAIMLNAANVKAIKRAAEGYAALGRFEDLLKFAEENRNIAPEEMDTFIETAKIKLKEAERNKRKKEAALRRELDEKKRIEDAVRQRGIRWKGSLFENSHPAAKDSHVVLLASPPQDRLVWPVIFMYPENGQSDFVEKFQEDCPLEDMLVVLLSEPPAWDSGRKYSPSTVRLMMDKMADDSSQVEVPKTATLLQTLSRSDACIKPPEELPTTSGDATSAATEATSGPRRVHVSLTDCLACSGCVTSAETVLIQQQSHEEVNNVVLSNRQIADPQSDLHRNIVVTVSHQAVVSFAAKYQVDVQEAARKLCYFFKDHLGAKRVLDLSLARHIALAESQRELLAQLDHSDAGQRRPIFTSICPGWVCYVEKTRGDIVPYLSRVRSPQQIAGVILKRILSTGEDHDRQDGDLRLGPSRKLYHISLMPCFDKKLEASRREFIQTSGSGSSASAAAAIKDVDCVITPVEVEAMLQMKNLSFSDLGSRPLDVIHPQWPGQAGSSGLIESHSGSGSGGYAENVARAMYRRRCLTSEDPPPPSSVPFEIERNRDFMVVTIPLGDQTSSSSPTTFSCAIVNGFRNIQTIIQRMRRKALKLDYIEVMACPRGCLNGGAQLRSELPPPPVNIGEDPEDPLARLEELYANFPVSSCSLDPHEEPLKAIYSDWFPTADSREEMLYTTFHAVPPTKNLLTATW